MSTKSTIASNLGWRLYEEMLEEEVWLDVRDATFVADKWGVKLKLEDRVIDAIRNARPEQFPHLRMKGVEG